MKVYKLEFTYFDGVQWEDIEVSIIALSKISIMRSFIDATYFAHHFSMDTKAYRNYIWNSVKSYIAEEELEFPTNYLIN